MAWFQKFCRDSGLMIHNILHPDHEKREISRKTEQKQVNDKVTLRRTTIEEIEIKQSQDDQQV